MASALGMMVGGAIVNALAFTGGNFLFSKLNGNNADAERKRHDLAVEKLEKAQAAWTEKRTQRLDWINDELRKQANAVQTFQNVEEAIKEYNVVTGKSLPPLEKEPVLSDFYTPSQNQRESEITFIVLGFSCL